MTKTILLLPKFVLSKMSHESEHSKSKFYYPGELSHAELLQSLTHSESKTLLANEEALLPDLEPNIFPFGSPPQSISTYCFTLPECWIQFLILEFWGGVIRGDFEKNVRFKLLVSSLSLGTWSFILAICRRLIVQVSHKLVKDFSKQKIEKGQTSKNIFSKELEVKLL